LLTLRPEYKFMRSNMDKLRELELKSNIMRAEAAKAELEFKIEKLYIDIERMKDHVKKQDELIQTHTLELGSNK